MITKKIREVELPALTKVLSLAALPLLLVFSGPAQAAEPQPPAVVETWACSYLDDADIDDVRAARDYYVKQADKAGLSLGPAFMWSLVKGDVNFDLLWLEPHQNFAAFGAALDAEAAAEEMAGVQARFDAITDCSPRIGLIHAAFQKDENNPPTGNAFISSNACRLNKGVTPAHLNDLRMHVNGVLGNMGDVAPNAVYTITPTTGGPTTPDFVLFTVNDSSAAYAKFVGGLVTSEAGQRLGRHLNMLGDCNSAMWGGEQMIAAPAQ